MAEGSMAARKMEAAVDILSDMNRMTCEEKDDRSDGLKVRHTQINQMIDSFECFDRNDDKELNMTELASVFRALGQNPTQHELMKIFSKLDTNNDGKISKDQYVQMLRDHLQTEDEVKDEMKKAFKFFDRNGLGTIDRAALTQVLRMAGEGLDEQEATELMKAIDTNGDGLIDIDEFVEYICKITPGKESTCTQNKRKQEG